jgi:hypothetical protein
MQVLSYGFLQPENGDPGSVWFPALNDNIQKLNDHNHDGSNSSLLNLSSFLGGTVAILAANWVLDVPGRYKQTVIVPTGYSYDDFNVLFKLENGDLVYPSVERVSGTSFDIYTCDNTLGYTAVFR